MFPKEQSQKRKGRYKQQKAAKNTSLLLLMSSSTDESFLGITFREYSFPASQIIAIEAQGRKVIVHTARQDFDSIHNMDYWLEQLPKNSFFQTHRSFIVNFEHIVDFDHSTIHLSNQQITAYLTRRKYSSFKNAYLLYLESMR